MSRQRNATGVGPAVKVRVITAQTYTAAHKKDAVAVV